MRPHRSPRRGAIAALLPYEGAEGRWTRFRPARGTLDSLLPQSRCVQRSAGAPRRHEALDAAPHRERRQLLLTLFFFSDISTFLDHPEPTMTTRDELPTTIDGIRDTVRARYGAIAERVAEGATAASCCGTAGSSGCCGATGESWDPITSDLYEAGQTAGIPAEALLASLGCGNPTALADLREGETVLDLGSGGGIDVLLSAKRVGPAGKRYGLDMTDEVRALVLG